MCVCVCVWKHIICPSHYAYLNGTSEPISLRTHLVNYTQHIEYQQLTLGGVADDHCNVQHVKEYKTKDGKDDKGITEGVLRGRVDGPAGGKRGTILQLIYSLVSTPQIFTLTV